jgi:sterol desaturase/sphingolipid hydroxylase (fatty acid hydroxylase superfamily)
MSYFIIINFLYSIKVVFDYFIASYCTLLLMAYITRCPIINIHQSFDKLEKKINTVLCTTIIEFSESVLLTYYFISNKYIHFEYHCVIETTVNIGGYILFVEAFHYIYHRLMHTPLFFKRIHHKHHEERILHSIDTLYMTYCDVIFNTFLLGLPVIFLHMNIIEYNLMMYLFTTGDMLMHSKMISDHHLIHHRYLKGNYCLLFPIFDITFGTYIQENRNYTSENVDR